MQRPGYQPILDSWSPFLHLCKSRLPTSESFQVLKAGPRTNHMAIQSMYGFRSLASWIKTVGFPPWASSAERNQMWVGSERHRTGHGTRSHLTVYMALTQKLWSPQKLM